MQNLPYDFIMIANPPGGSINATYMIGAYPTFILIKPDRSIPERDIWPINNTILRNKIIQHGGIPQACPSGEGTVDLVANPEEGGEVTGAGVYYYGFDVEVNAIANDGWLFVNWTDEDGVEVSDEPLYTFIMPESDLLLTANFEAITYTLTLIANPEEGGGITGEGEFQAGNPVEINALPAENWIFINWTNEDGEEVSTEALYNFEMPESDLVLIANFQNVSATIGLVSEKMLAVFPNPASHFLNVRVQQTLIGSDYVIYDYRGRIMLSGTIQSDNFMIDLNELVTGVYLISIPDQMTDALRFIKR